MDLLLIYIFAFGRGFYQNCQRLHSRYTFYNHLWVIVRESLSQSSVTITITWSTDYLHRPQLVALPLSLHSSHYPIVRSTVCIARQTWMFSWLTLTYLFLLSSCSCAPLHVLHRSCVPPSPCSVVHIGFPGRGKGLITIR